MREFKIETDTSSKRRETRLLRGAILSITVAASAPFIFHSSLQAEHLRWLGLSMLVGAITGWYALAFRLGLQRAKRRMVFALSDKEFIRKRSGWPDDRIAFSEIDGLYEKRGGLVVESVEPLRRISIPREVNGFDTIRAELAKHHSLSVHAKPSRARLSWTGLVVMIVSILSWAAVIFIFYEVMRPR